MRIVTGNQIELYEEKAGYKKQFLHNGKFIFVMSEHPIKNEKKVLTFPEMEKGYICADAIKTHTKEI